jgi:hypothetical protein
MTAPLYIRREAHQVPPPLKRTLAELKTAPVTTQGAV